MTEDMIEDLTAVENDRLARLEADARCVALLRAHIPLTLLMDLAQADPHSEELYAMEAADLGHMDWAS